LARPVLIALFALSGTASAGCARPTLPDPRVTAREFAAAASRGDAAAVNGMLTERARGELGLAGTKRLLADAHTEIVSRSRAMASNAATVRAVAEVKYVDGEYAVLELEEGRFKVSAASGLPPGARTPAEALSELRAALARRSYGALLRILSSDARGAIESDMRSLVGGLDHPDSLEANVHGETAEVAIPGGHKVVLKREGGVWRVQDFD